MPDWAGIGLPGADVQRGMIGVDQAISIDVARQYLSLVSHEHTIGITGAVIIHGKKITSRVHAYIHHTRI